LIPSRGHILNGVLVGAALGAVILFFFGDGWAMALYLAGEGILIGGVIGGLVGVFLRLISWGS